MIKMDLEEYLEYVKTGKKIIGGSKEHEFMHGALQDALRITHKINSEFHTPDEIQQLFAELTNTEINETLGLIPPFNTDFGKNIHVGKNVFINSGCKMQDQGGIFIGDDVGFLSGFFHAIHFCPDIFHVPGNLVEDLFVGDQFPTVPEHIFVE